MNRSGTTLIEVLVAIFVMGIGLIALLVLFPLGALQGFPKAVVAGSPNTIERDIRYTWAYLCQRPRSSDTSIVSCAVVVYNRRPLSPNGALSLNEYVYANVSYFDTTRNVITIDY